MTPLQARWDAVDPGLGAGLADAVRRLAGPGAEIAAVSRAANPYATASRSELVGVELASGERLAIFVKLLGGEQGEHPDKLVREREPRVYEGLLAGRDLPVPRFLGWAEDETTGGLNLFLEQVDGWNLKYHGLDRWRAVARRLAQLHRALTVPGVDLDDADFLLRLDRDYLLAWAERALAAVLALSPALGGRLRRTLDNLGPATELVAAQPPTLVHNDLAPKNAIAEVGGGDRTWIVDWEMAGVGCGMLDVAHLTHGLPSAEAARMVEVYRGELSGAGLTPGGEEGSRLLAACRLHGAVHRLAHAGAWRVPAVRVEEWIVECESLNRELGR